MEKWVEKWVEAEEPGHAIEVVSTRCSELTILHAGNVGLLRNTQYAQT